MRPIAKDARFLEVQRLLGELEQDYGLSSGEIASFREDLRIPVAIFSPGISSLEAIAKHLVENKGMRLGEAAKAAGRSKQGMRQALVAARRKGQGRLPDRSSPHDIPLRLIAEKKHPVLGTLVIYLREERKLSFSDIARLLGRDPRTVWTAYRRCGR